VSCPEHGVRQVRVPWAEPSSRFTALFERFAIDVLLETCITGAAEILGITWDEDEAHHRGRRRTSAAMGRTVAEHELRTPLILLPERGIAEPKPVRWNSSSRNMSTVL